VGSSEDGVLIEESPPAHHLEPGAEPLSAHDDSPGPGPGLRLRASDNFLPVTEPALPGRGRGGRWSCRSRGGLQGLVGVRATHREVETFKPTWTADGLEEVGEDLGVDSLLEDDLKDGGTLTGEDVLTGPGLSQGSRAGLSASSRVGVHSPGEALDVGRALTEDVRQGLDRPRIVLAAELYRLTGKAGTRWSPTIIRTCWSSSIIRTRRSSFVTVRTRWSCIITTSELYLCESELSQ
jgi:hypothetical protein